MPEDDPFLAQRRLQERYLSASDLPDLEVLQKGMLSPGGKTPSAQNPPSTVSAKNAQHLDAAWTYPQGASSPESDGLTRPTVAVVEMIPQKDAADDNEVEESSSDGYNDKRIS